MRSATGVALALALSALQPAEAADKSKLVLELSSPEEGAVIGDPAGMAFLSGRALALFGEFQTFDIVFTIDTSESTSAPSGADIDGDGEIGKRRGEQFLSVLGKVLPIGNTDRGDSILAAEIAAVETLLDQLDPRTTRVGVVTFSGDYDPMYPDSATRVPLTADFDKVREGLEEVLDEGPGGMTNMQSGVNRAMVELAGTSSAYSVAREDARRIIIFLTDGRPTLPYEGRPSWNTREAIGAAKRGARLGIRIDTYAIGDEALREPIVAVEMARVSNGVFTPVRRPSQLRAIFEEVSFAEIEELSITNKTARADASYVIRNADGSFSALIAMKTGINTLEVFARATDGSKARVRRKVRFVADGDVQPLSPRLVAERNRLLENQLLDLKQRRLEIETDRDEDVRRALEIEIEHERAAAKVRAEAARKRLEIDVDEPD